MMDHLFEGKYLSPFKTDNPKIIGRLKALEAEFQRLDGVDPDGAKDVLQQATILHGELMSCDFCGQTNTWEHTKSCPLHQEDGRQISTEMILSKICEWNTGYCIGLSNEAFHESLLKAPTFMLGFGRGQAERVRRHQDQTDSLYRLDEYGKDEYRRIAI